MRSIPSHSASPVSLPSCPARPIAWWHRSRTSLLGDSLQGLAGLINRLIIRLNQSPVRLVSSINPAIDRPRQPDVRETSNFLQPPH